MLKHRIISFPLLLALAFLVVCWKDGGPWIFAALVLPITLAAVIELANIARNLGLMVNLPVAAIAALLVMAKYGTAGFLQKYSFALPSALTVAVILFVLLMLMLLFDRNRERAVKQLFATPGIAGAALLIVLPLSRIYFEYGAMIFLALVLCTKASDTGGYIVGMISNKLIKNGNHKIVPSISPKKSWEGTVGAAVFSIVTALIFASCGVLTMPIYGVCIFGFLAFLGSFAGDLTESQLKRAAGIKDSAHWIPGMGGILDVIDSFIYNAPLFYLIFSSKGI